MLTTTTSNKLVNPLSPDGCVFGQSATDKVAFYGATPIVQPTSSSQASVATLADASGGTASTGILTLTGTYNSTILADAIAALAAKVNANIALSNQMRADLVSLGLIKGS